MTATDAYEGMINGHIYEALVERDRDTLEMIPRLAERWTISPDKMRFRFFLKKGVRWSDGPEFTADDIIYSFRVLKDPKTANSHVKVYYLDVQSVEKIDRYTVEFLYSRPYYLALEFCGGMPVVPKHIFDDGTDFNTHKNNRLPIGTGPFKFQKWETGKRIILEANENYWGRKPGIKKIIYKIVMEQNVALQMLKKGELDVVALREIQWVRQTGSPKFTENFYKLKYYQPNFRYIGWNAKRPFFSDSRVRLALGHLINRKAILDKLMFGLGEMVTGNFYIFSKYYNKNVKQVEYDPEKGKRLLSEAGWRDTDNDGILDRDGRKFSFTFMIPSGTEFSERLASILKEDFSKVGIEMDIRKYEWAVFVNKLHNREFDAVTLAWGLGYSGDPYQLWHSSQAEKGSNFCNFINSEADDIMDKARVEFDESKRVKLYHRFHEIIYDEQPYTFLFAKPTLAAISKRFDNVKVHVTGLNIDEWIVRLEK